MHPAQAIPEGLVIWRALRSARCCAGGSSAGPRTTATGRGVSFVRWFEVSLSSSSPGSPGHVSSLSRPSTGLGIRPVIHDHQQEGADRLVVVSRCVSAAGIGFLVILFPPGNWALLAVGLPARSGSDPDGVSTFRTLKLRPGWVPSISRGRRCSPGLATITGPRLPHLSGPSLRPATTTHLNETPHHETSTKGSNDFTRPVFPSPDALGWNVSVLGFPALPALM